MSRLFTAILFSALLAGCHWPGVDTREHGPGHPWPIVTNAIHLRLPPRTAAYDTNYVPPTNILIGTASLYDSSFTNCWSSIERSNDLRTWWVIASNLFGVPDPSHPWTLPVSNGPCGFFRAVKQVGVLQ